MSSVDPNTFPQTYMLLKAKQVAARLNVSESTVKGLRRSGKLQFVELSKRSYRYSSDDPLHRGEDHQPVSGCRWEKEILALVRESIIVNGDDVFIDIGVTKNGRRKRKYVREEARWCLEYIPWKHSRTWFYERFRDARNLAGFPDYRPHDMRHSLASAIISNGATLSDVGTVLGHESIQSSARYAHLYPERQMEVLKKVGKK